LFFFRPKRKRVDHIVVGLGNPGPDYAHTRHNLGFAVVDQLAKNWTDADSWGVASNYLYIKGKLGGKSFVLLKPTTYMNLSGKAIRKAGLKFEVNQENIIVVHDDLDVNYAKVKLKYGGSPAGHKGVISIANALGTDAFHRLKIGIGLEGIKGGEHYVLEQLDDDEWKEFQPTIDIACEGLKKFLEVSPKDAVHYINTHGKKLGGDFISE
jgi:PTH1 family peptidyl-tRNA hydrolase